MKIIENELMPTANGHYSTCVEHNDTLYLSGQLPIISVTRNIPSGIEDQTSLVLSNMEQVLLAAGVDRNAVIQVRIYLSNIDLWDQVNAIYAGFFGAHKPARTIVPCGVLHYGCLIELEAIAALK